MRQFVAITKALACEKRLRILMALRKRELCEGVITEMLGIAPATTSHHLWILRQAGLVDSEKTARCVCYRLVVASPLTLAGKTLRWLGECLALDPQIAEDAAQVQGLLLRSSAQTACQERRRRLAKRCSETLACPPRRHDGNHFAR